MKKWIRIVFLKVTESSFFCTCGSLVDVDTCRNLPPGLWWVTAMSVAKLFTPLASFSSADSFSNETSLSTSKSAEANNRKSGLHATRTFYTMYKNQIAWWYIRTAISQDVQTWFSVQLAFVKFLSKIRRNF